MSFDSLGRSLVLSVAGNRFVTRTVSKYGMKLGAKRFVAGESKEQALETVKEMNEAGLVVTLDFLGESVSTREEAEAAANEAVSLFEAIAEKKVNSNVSVKLTQLGLDLDQDFCLENMDKVARAAKEHDNFVRIDMEDSPRTDATLDIFDTLFDRYGKEHIGVVIQSYLYRSEDDVKRLGEKGANLRIVKGAYKEPKSVAFAEKRDVDDNFMNLVKIHLDNGCYTAVATHDERMIAQTKQYVKEQQIPHDRFEFQMLYGVRRDLHHQLVKEGYKVRIYTPYGEDWYPYFTRRIAERPANALFVLKSLVKE